MPLYKNPLQLKAAAQLELRKRKARKVFSDNATNWHDWLVARLPKYFSRPLADRHRSVYDWSWNVELGIRPRPFIAIWPRGGAKSTTAEIACALLGQRQTRKYCIYVSGTQDQANDHVGNVKDILTECGSTPGLSKLGYNKAWRVDRVVTDNGYVVDAIGLDTAARGIKFEEKRPDLIIFDDIDGRHDSKEITSKKISTLTESILPAGSIDCAIMGIQNLIIPHGIFAQLAKPNPPFLIDRIISGPFPALEGSFEYESMELPDGSIRLVITKGVPTWEGQCLIDCENLLNSIGSLAFKRESQHDMGAIEGTLFKKDWINAFRVNKLPYGISLIKTCVGIDPQTGPEGETGICVAGLGTDGHGYVLADLSINGSPNEWAKSAVAGYHSFNANALVPEKNQGGDMVISTISNEDNSVRIEPVWASQGKVARAEPIAQLVEQGRIHHVGIFPMLEDELITWVQGNKSPNRLDAYVHALTWLDIKLNVSEPNYGDNKVWSSESERY